MKQPDFDGRAAELLYGDVDDVESNLQNPPENFNLFDPPSIINGEKLDDAREIAEAAYRQGYSDSMRINRAGRIVENDPFLDVLRKRVEEIRKKKIKRGEIKPVTKKERKWRLGL